MHTKGEIGVDETWRRLAVDVTYYRQLLYLTLVDCGPGRFAIWSEICRESADFVIQVLREGVFGEGPGRCITD